MVEYANIYFIVIDTSNCEMGKKGKKPLGFAKGRKEIQQCTEIQYFNFYLH